MSKPCKKHEVRNDKRGLTCSREHVEGKKKPQIRLAARIKGYEDVLNSREVTEKVKRHHNRPGSLQKGRCK